MKEYKKIILQFIKDTMKQKEVFGLFEHNVNSFKDQLDIRINVCKEFLNDMNMIRNYNFKYEWF